MSVAWNEPKATVESLAEWFGIPADFLKEEFGLADVRGGVSIPYHDATGKHRFDRKRIGLTGKGKFHQPKGVSSTGYGLNHLTSDTKEVFIVEGESDVWTLSHAGLEAVGIPGATQRETIRKAASVLASRGVVPFVWAEPDEAGVQFVTAWAEFSEEAKVIQPPDGFKDPADLWKSIHDVDNFKLKIWDLHDRALPAEQYVSESLREAVSEARRIGDRFLTTHNLHELVATEVQNNGFAGDTSPVEIAFFAFFSALLQPVVKGFVGDLPLRIMLLGPSSAGKSEIVRQALRLIPTDAFERFDGASERSLIYSPAEFKHKTVVMWEADSIPEDGPAATAFRGLTDGEGVRYDVVVEGDRGEGFVTRHYEKEGPTALITTGTRSATRQTETRLLVLEVQPDSAQIQNTLLSLVISAAGMRTATDVSHFHAAYTWIRLAGSRRVVIPQEFGKRIAKLMPKGAMKHERTQRDFPQLLSLIKTITMVRQLYRAKDDDGRLITERADYETAVSLASPLFQIAASDGVTEAVRGVVEAVGKVTQTGEMFATSKQVAELIERSNSTAHDNLKRAEKLGLLNNTNPGSGRRAQWVTDAPLPETTSLPSPDEVYGLAAPEELPEGRKVEVNEPELVSIAPSGFPDDFGEVGSNNEFSWESH